MQQSGCRPVGFHFSSEPFTLPVEVRLLIANRIPSHAGGSARLQTIVDRQFCTSSLVPGQADYIAYKARALADRAVAFWVAKMRHYNRDDLTLAPADAKAFAAFSKVSLSLP